MEIFRWNNVLFIAVNNGIGGEKPDTLELASFINIMSEWYARESRIWSDNRQDGGIVNAYYRRPVLDFY